MITYRFVSQSLLGQAVKVQYSKYSSNIRIDLGSGTFPFEYTTDQKGGTYYFYVPSLDTTYPKTIDIPPIDFYINTLNVPDCDISGLTNNIPSCDIENQNITIPVCDVDYEIEIVTPTPTPTFSIICPSISAVTVGPIEISGGEYTTCVNQSAVLLHQYNSSGLYICDVPSPGDSILPDSLFVDEITVLVPDPYTFGGPCQYCFNINTGEQFECNQVITSPTPTPSITSTVTPTMTTTPTVTPTIELSPTPTETTTPTVTPTIELSPTPTETTTPTPSVTTTLTPTSTITPTLELSPTPTETTTPTMTATPTNTPTPSITSTITPTPTITPTITPTVTTNCVAPDITNVTYNGGSSFTVSWSPSTPTNCNAISVSVSYDQIIWGNDTSSCLSPRTTIPSNYTGQTTVYFRLQKFCPTGPSPSLPSQVYTLNI